eukprot:scaffold128975_cov45-Attheya_sp.AAC.1
MDHATAMYIIVIGNRDVPGCSFIECWVIMIGHVVHHVRTWIGAIKNGSAAPPAHRWGVSRLLNPMSSS